MNLMNTIKLFIFLFIVILVSTTGCQKEFPQINTLTPCDSTVIHDTIHIHDTIRIHDTVTAIALTKTQILIQKDWLVDEVARSISGTNSQYIRGGMNTTGTNYSNLKFHFNLNGTGTYTDENSIIHPLTWNFTGSGQRNIHLSVGPPFSTIYDWNMVEIGNDYLHCTTVSGSNILLTARFIQTP